MGWFRTTPRAVASALKQPETAEVVVVDDASGDDGATLRAAEAADDGSGRLKVFALPRNAGPSAARNAAIRASKAAWIAILDSDDQQQQLFLGPNGGSMRLVSGTQLVQVISSEAPLGRAMLGKCEGDAVSIQVAPIRQQFEVLRVH